MFEDYVYGNSPAAYANFIWINDTDHLNRLTAYMKAFTEHGFDVVEYKDDLSFRIEYEEKLNAGERKLAVLNSGEKYIPYDILNRFEVYTASLRALFPKLNMDTLRHKSPMDLDLLTMTISKNFDNLTNKEQTEKFFETIVFSKENLLSYFQSKLEQVLQLTTSNPSYRD